MIIGTGVFNLPYAFVSSGLLLGVGILSICAVFAWFCLIWFLEVSARSEGVTAAEENADYQDSVFHQITFRKFDLNTMMHIFFGMKGKILTQIVLCLYCYGLLWAFAAVFASSVDSLFFQFVYKTSCSIYDNPSENCYIGYYICLSIYATIVVPLACMNLEETAIVQVIMTIYRFSAFGVMFVTLIVGLSNPINPFIDYNSTITSSSHIAYDTMVDWSGFAVIFTTSAVALNFHFCLPDIIKPLKTKKFVRRMTSAALFVAFAFYILLGLLSGMYFGKNTLPLATLNWQNYTGFDGGWGGEVSQRPAWAIAVQLWVMLFPVFDMISIFPMVGVTLGDNILQFLPEDITCIFPGKFQSRFCNPNRSKTFSRVLCRLIATVPPIILAAALGKLDKIFDFTGLFAFFLELLFPCALQLMSVYFCESKWGKGSSNTMYTMFISSKGFVVVTLIFGILAFLFSVFVVISDTVDPNFVKNLFSKI
eukprot:TRINITY_DN3109_c0_g2_i1.p1 TRINITY_DN3109_c0_g2~~TRINITY_DN3109_c0_g2_i1.p1  ORF type:complete len:479 (+),score=39.79 TRINITY_DN3109_c0_g2_i1:1048-2484(+)